jgi:NADP-dependent 3-hydroxy acid dehydrogenase YdfG
MTTTSPSPVWFITGATSGIGQELASQALAAGESVVAVARDTGNLAIPQSDRLLAIDADVRDEGAVQKAVERALSRFRRIDVVANNAGFGLFGAVEESTDAEARDIFDTNVFGVLNVLRATLPTLRAQRSGHVLQGSSYFGQTAIPGVGLLSATKYAVEGLSDALVAELAPLGIKVTMIQPGLTATPFLSNMKAAAGTHSDYDATVRGVYQVVSQLPASAFSATSRVAEGIRKAVSSPTPPRRLALSTSAVQEMRSALTQRLDDLDGWVGIAEAVEA